MSCDWDLWRQKCFLDFGISPEYFDLVRNISGPQRYLQISAWFELGPDQVVKVNPIEGVYEAPRGFIEAMRVNDFEAAAFFASLLNKSQKKYLLERVREINENLHYPRSNFQEVFTFILSDDFTTEGLINYLLPWELVLYGYADLSEILNISDEWTRDDYVGKLVSRGYKEALPLIDPSLPSQVSSVIYSGHVDFLDSILHKVFYLPKDFSISRDVPKRKFWQEFTPITFPDKVYENYKNSYDSEYFINAIYSYNQQILDFFLSLYISNTDDMIEIIHELELYSHRKINPENVYTVLKTLLDMAWSVAYLEPDVPEPLLLEELEKGDLLEEYPEYIDKLQRKCQGNIPLLQEVLSLGIEFDKQPFPVTERLIQES